MARFNTDQGCQFTSHDFLAPLLERNTRISMDGKGRALDNVFVERLWPSVKYEWLYALEVQTVPEFYTGLGEHFQPYNNDRLHQSLNHKIPRAIHFA